MNKSIYEEATDKNIITTQVVINTPTSARLLPITADEKVIDEIQQALTKLEQAQKQEKLLGHYKDLAEVRKELYDLTTNFNPSNKDRMIVLFTQETLVSNIIKELEND